MSEPTIPPALTTIARLYALAVLDGQHENAEALRAAAEALAPGREWLPDYLEHTVRRYREDRRVAEALRRDDHDPTMLWRRAPQVLIN